MNGIQTMSHDYLNLVGELADLQDMGVARFRLSPHSCDMVEVAAIFRDALDRRIDAKEAAARLDALKIDAPFSNGFYYGKPGHRFSRAAANLKRLQITGNSRKIWPYGNSLMLAVNDAAGCPLILRARRKFSHHAQSDSARDAALRARYAGAGRQLSGHYTLRQVDPDHIEMTMHVRLAEAAALRVI